MKKTNYIRKLTTYFVLCCLSFSSLLFYVPGTTVLSAPGDPTLEILTPEEGTELDQALVTFTGRISDDLTPPEKITFNVYEILADTEESLDITDTGEFTVVNNTGSGDWMYSREFSQGSHTVLFRIEDEDSNRTEVQISFTVIQPPIVPSDDPDTSTKQDGINTEPIAVETENESDNNTEVETLSEEEEVEIAPVPRPFVVSLNILPNGVENSKDFLTAEDMTNVPVDAVIELIIKESGDLNYKDEPLIVTSDQGTTIKSTESSAGQSPEKKDGEYRITFTPTANLEYSTTYYVFVNPAITNGQNGRIYQRFVKFTTAPVAPSHEIHGNFGNNTNSCANCHSTHNGNDEKLLGGKYGADTTKNLCMSCHDGTNGAPMPDHYNAKNQHFNYTDGLEATYSCTSCHNPHTAWTEENPNKLKGHPETTYKKQGTAKGISTDFSLCLQCHDGGKAVNIKKYYVEDTLLAESGHKITAEDGTSLNGQLTCADCHETHGSNNLKLLKENLGNAPLADENKFKTVGAEWTVENERNFCLKCHNGNTELYGKNPVFNDQTESHQDTAKSCSSCHGAGEDIKEQMRSAAHAPKRFIVETPEVTSEAPAPLESEGTSDTGTTPQTPEEPAKTEETTEETTEVDTTSTTEVTP
ncbi:MAG: cytochrome c3 family protein [Bacillota bacterium]